MTVARALCLVPALVGWLLGVYFHGRALGHLRSPLPSWRLARFLLAISFSPRLGARYNVDGLRFRTYSIVSMVAGVALTILLVVLFQPAG